jgi:hypothetical protein
MVDHSSAPALYIARRAVCAAEGSPVGLCQLFAVWRGPDLLNVMVRASAPVALIECRAPVIFAMVACSCFISDLLHFEVWIFFEFLPSSSPFKTQCFADCADALPQFEIVFVVVRWIVVYAVTLGSPDRFPVA